MWECLKNPGHESEQVKNTSLDAHPEMEIFSAKRLKFKTRKTFDLPTCACKRTIIEAIICRIEYGSRNM